jgi:hypothetical protein
MDTLLIMRRLFYVHAKARWLTMCGEVQIKWPINWQKKDCTKLQFVFGFTTCPIVF